MQAVTTWRVSLIAGAFLASATLAGCGGGSTGELPPPPPSPDFSIGVSPGSATISQGTTSSGIQVSVQALNGFSGDVQVTLTGLPSGVTSNPQSPFSVASGGSVMMLLGATSTATTGNTSISVQGSSGTLSHSAPLSLTVQNGSAANLPRTTYARADSQAALDDPLGEPHHRHLVYVPGNHHLFVANRARGRVDIFSTADGSRVGSIDASGASSVDISADGATVWVGSVTEQIATVDTGTLQVKNRYLLPGLVPIPNIYFDRPEEVVALAGGKVLVRLRQANAADALLALWDPGSNTLTSLTSLVPQMFQNGVGVLARSGDHTHVLVASNDGSGNALVLDGEAAILAAPKSLGSGTVVFAAANSVGSQFAVVLSSDGSERLLLLDSSLDIVASAAVNGVRGLIFSHDDQSVFLSQNQGSAVQVSALSSVDLHSLGAVADTVLQGVSSELEDVDETGLAFGVNNRGVSFVDTSQPGAMSSPTPALAEPPALLPDSGTNIGGTAATLAGLNFGNNPTVHFAAQAATVSSSSATQIQASSPASTTNGAVNVTAYFPDGSLALAPDAFTYGAQILEVLPNAGNSAGGDSVVIYGYGFGNDPSKLTVNFGSASATIQKLEDLPLFSPSLGLDSTYPFPLQRITLTTPAGTAGKVSIKATSASGSAALNQSFQYLKSSQVFAKAGFYKFILYDQKRQWLYLSDIDHLDVFDLSAGTFRSGILPPGGPPPDAWIHQAVLSPDASKLFVADFGAQSVYLIDPDTADGSAVNTGGVAGDANSGPVRLAATSAQTLFVGLAGISGSPSPCSACLQQMNLSTSPVSTQTAPQPEISSLTSAPLLDASGDGSIAFLSFAAAPGQPMAVWDAAASGHFATAPLNIPATDIATASDGTFFAVENSGTIEIRDTNLALHSVISVSELQAIPQRTNVPGIAMHPSGALVYAPFLTGPPPLASPFTGLLAGVDIFDARTGRLRARVMLPEPLAMLSGDVDGLHGRFLAVDENGQRLFALTASGLSVVELASVPLGLGTIAPESAPASGGTTLTIRGSGFQSGVTVSIGGKSTATTFVDMNTLTVVSPALSSGPQRVVITNPDGESISVDAAFTAN